jgi:seryl-tRNA synthetase
MIDIQLIRDNPDILDNALKNRNLPPISNKLIELDLEYRKNVTNLQAMQAKRNEIAKSMGGIADKSSNEFKEMMLQASEIKKQMAELEAEVSGNKEIENILASTPNIPEDIVPVGIDETSNKEIRVVGEKTKLNFQAKHHFELGENLGLIDFEQAVYMSGSRFVLLKGMIAKLERALANFMLDIHTGEFGYTEISPPYLVKDQAMYGVGQLPKFEEDSFVTTNGYRLIPTAEVSLTNIVADKILNLEELPLRFTAYTPCFRSEAGSAGRDTRGMIRLHQFSKVELVSITDEDNSKDEHERMLSCAEEILKRLKLPYRVMLLSTGDMGFSAQKTYDLEVWLPAQNMYREISSCSNCGSYQARRMKARYRKNDDKSTKFVHTLNGSALAVGRTIVAILENYQQEDGSIIIPGALVPYMGGITKI